MEGNEVKGILQDPEPGGALESSAAGQVSDGMPGSDGYLVQDAAQSLDESQSNHGSQSSTGDKLSETGKPYYPDENYDREQTGYEYQDPRYQSIGGWLVLIVIGLFVTPIRLIYTLINDYLPIFTQGAWKILITKGNEAYSPFWAPLLFFEVMGNSFFAVFAIILLVKLFQKKRNVPKLMIVYYLSNLALIVLDTILAGFIPFLAQNNQMEDITSIGRSMITSLIWTAYFIRSERVKGTFIR